MLILVLHTCARRFPCRDSIQILNNSNQDVLVATGIIGTASDGTRKCQLTFVQNLSSKQSINYFIVKCIQNGFGGDVEIYIVDPQKINDTTLGKLYGCDSIGYYNDILKKYTFKNPEDFSKTDYKIVYP